MENLIAGFIHIRKHMMYVPTGRGMGWGLIGGLAGTMVMDILFMGVLLALRQPALLCFSIVGNTVSQFLAMFGLYIAGGVPTGVAAHYVIGPLVGLFFGLVVTIFPVFQQSNLKKIMIAAFVYVEILSQPILAMTPILLKMKAPATFQWFGGAFVMHLILSIVLGIIVWFGLRPAFKVTKSRLTEHRIKDFPAMVKTNLA
jgi:hypothetical protein